jgi:glycosyltransferase involved in cell wall biosynthesis
MTEPLRIASWPRPGINPYCDLYYGALARVGVVVEYVDDITRRPLVGPSGPTVDVVHFHWNIEGIWRAFGRDPVRQALGLGAFVRLLRRLKRAGVTILWTAHELAPPEDETWIDRLGYRLCARSADLCLCHSDVCRQEVLRRFGVAPASTMTIPIGTYEAVLTASRSAAETRAKWGLPSGKRLLVCFGYQRPRKGLEVALEAMRGLERDHHLVVHCSTRGGARRKWLRGLRETYRHAPHISFLHEELDGSDLADLLTAADCVILPYLEIVGSAALAACLTVGRGVVVSDLPYFRESLAEEPDAGVFFRPGDPAGLRKAIATYFAMDRARREAAVNRLASTRRWEHVAAPVAEWLQAHAVERTTVEDRSIQTARA